MIPNQGDLLRQIPINQRTAHRSVLRELTKDNKTEATTNDMLDSSRSHLENLAPAGREALVGVVGDIRKNLEGKGLGQTEINTSLMIAGALVTGPTGLSLAEGTKELAEPLADYAFQLSQTKDYAPMAKLADGIAKKASAQCCGSGAVGATLVAAGHELQLTAVQKDPQAGLACGSSVEPMPFFTHSTKKAVRTRITPNNASGLQEVDYQDGKYKIIDVKQFLSGKKEVLIGFGKPNVYTMIPTAEGDETGADYEKLDAFMFFRKEAKRRPVDKIQSGLFIRPRNLPPEAADRMRVAMDKVAGKKTASCAHANAGMLTDAGFTSGGKPLSGKLLPSDLFKRIANNGLEFDGKKIHFDIINTTEGTAEEHFDGVKAKEYSAPRRAIKKIFGGHKASVGERKALLKGLKDAGEAQEAAPESAILDGGTPLKIRNSRHGAVGNFLTRLWEGHKFWEALPSSEHADINKFLPDTLTDKYSKGDKLSAVDKLKSKAFSPGMVKKMRGGIADTWDDAGEYGPGQIAKMLETDESGERKIYNMVITGDGKENRIAIGRIDGGDKLPDWVLTKHLMLSNYDPDVRFAGETWAEPFLTEEGKQGVRLHLNGNSGTYKPTDEQTEAAGEYMRAVFDGVEGVEIVTHSYAETNMINAMDKAKKKVDHEKRFAVDDAQYEAAKSLDGKTVHLKGADGKSKKYKIRHFKQVELEADYMDTPDEALLDANGMLRARTRYKKPGSDQVKDIQVEAKLPIPGEDDPSKRARIKGAEFDSKDDWNSAKEEILSTESSDAAVGVTRTALAKGQALSEVAKKTTMRDLFLVSPAIPVVGALAPAFVISLDSISAVSADGAEEAHWKRMEPQVFTKLPWTKKVDENRVARFEDLSAQVSEELGLTEVKENPYQETMAQLKASKSEE